MTPDSLALLLDARDRLAADLVAIDAEIATAWRVLGHDPAPGPPPGKPEPRPGRSRSGLAEKRAVSVARLLADRGPLRTKDIAAALGLAEANVSWVMGEQRGDLWRKTGNLFSPWELTAAGREVASTATRNGEPH